MHTQIGQHPRSIAKRDGSVCICGDFKVTVNQVLNVDSYPLPRVEELFANLSNGKFFSKLDMSSAYLQLPLSEESQQYVTINTHLGLFRYHRLPFAVSAAPAIFQHYMETLLRGLSGTAGFFLYVLVTGTTFEEHIHNLEAVLNKLNTAGLKLNRNKCAFLKTQIEYLDHVDGLHPSPIRNSLQLKKLLLLKIFQSFGNLLA